MKDNLIDKFSTLADAVKLKATMAGTAEIYSNACPASDCTNTVQIMDKGDKHFFKCFECGAGGDPITYIMTMYNFGYGDAIYSLSATLGLRGDMSDELIEQFNRDVKCENVESAITDTPPIESFKIENMIDHIQVKFTDSDGRSSGLAINPDTVLKHLIEFYIDQEMLPRMFRAIGNHIQYKGVYGLEQNMPESVKQDLSLSHTGAKISDGKDV